MFWRAWETSPSHRDLRIFFVGQFVLVVAVLIARDGFVHPIPFESRVAALTSLSVAVIGALWAESLVFLYLLWMTLVAPIGWGVSHVFLAVAYFFVLTPTGWIHRIVSGDPLTRHLRIDCESYWAPVPARSHSDRYFRQFV
ncbi:MAG: hypothetical protein KDA80_03800 [Planctomycetaceae bacterium]|nr:hypothetical protein [Planctomycetaceae bacterium]